MTGPEIVAALRGIVNSMSLITLIPQDKAEIRRLLEIMNICLYSPTYNSNAQYDLTRYRLTVDD